MVGFRRQTIIVVAIQSEHVPETLNEAMVMARLGSSMSIKVATIQIRAAAVAGGASA
jgi:hypothetical protein